MNGWDGVYLLELADRVAKHYEWPLLDESRSHEGDERPLTPGEFANSVWHVMNGRPSYQEARRVFMKELNYYTGIDFTLDNSLGEIDSIELLEILGACEKKLGMHFPVEDVGSQIMEKAGFFTITTQEGPGMTFREAIGDAYRLSY